MPRKRQIAGFLCILFILSLTLTVRPQVPSVDAATVDAMVRDALAAFRVPGASVAIVKGEEVIYLKGHGVRRVGTSEPVTPNTLFAIGSTTKAMTTTAMAILVDEGKMSWDDPVRRHVEFFRLSDPLADDNVTLRDLVAHRTGLSRHDLLWYGSPWNREEIIRKIGKVALTRSFRSVYQYQNIMFLTAGYAIQKAAGTPWEDFVQKRLFDPLGMRTANFSTTIAEKSPDYATPHRRNREGLIEPIRWRNIDNVGPAGSVNASARDMSQWVRFQLGDGTFEGKRIVSAAALAETKTPQMVMRLEGVTKAMNPDTHLMCYGMGWVLQDYRGHYLVSHGGAIDGFRARVVLVPEAKLGLVILANLGGTQMPEALSNTLVDYLLGLPRKDWNSYVLEQVAKQEAEQMARLAEREQKRHKGTKPSRELTAYVGTYEDPAYGTATVSLEDSTLVLHWSTFKRPLGHFHYDTFTIGGEPPLENEQVVFTLDAGGEVASLRMLGIEFKRARPRSSP